MGLRLSTGLGPVRFNQRIPWMVVAVVGLCCCGAGVIGNLTDDGDQKPQSQATQEAPSFVTQVTATPTRPTPSPTRSRAATVKPSPTPKRTTAKPKPSPTRTKPKTKAPTTDKRYSTCKEANSHGLGPYVKGVDPEYYWYDDRDDDGIVCERR